MDDGEILGKVDCDGCRRVLDVAPRLDSRVELRAAAANLRFRAAAQPIASSEAASRYTLDAIRLEGLADALDKDCDGPEVEPGDDFHRCQACGVPCACEYAENGGECEHAGSECRPDHPMDCECDDCDDDRTAAVYMADDDCDGDGRPAELAAAIPLSRWWRENADGKLELTTEPPPDLPPYPPVDSVDVAASIVVGFDPAAPGGDRGATLVAERVDGRLRVCEVAEVEPPDDEPLDGPARLALASHYHDTAIAFLDAHLFDEDEEPGDDGHAAHVALVDILVAAYQRGRDQVRGRALAFDVRARRADFRLELAIEKLRADDLEGGVALVEAGRHLLDVEPPRRAEVDSAAGFDRAPDRYTGNDREAIDRIRDHLGDEGFVAFCVGNALKYEARDGRKGDPRGDADKAVWYRRMAAHVRGYGPDPRANRPGFTPYRRATS
jgi:hypothetical protein